jgi:hypothetical protein
MGRGRSKAKETRVARDLKYSNHEMDLEKLTKELHGDLDSSNVENWQNSTTEDNLSNQEN